MAAGAYAEVVVGSGDAHLIKKYLRHVLIIVLPGVQNDFPDAAGIIGPYRPRKRRSLDDLRPGPDDGEEF